VSGPDRGRALDLYRTAAAGYDRAVSGRLVDRYRRRAIDRLWLASGDSVLDVACGTGANFALLADRVGPAGRLVGVDLSPDMLAIAAERVRRMRCENVTLRGGRVAAFGAKWAARWNLPVNFYVRRISRRYVTTFEGFEAPWRNLAEYLDSLTVDEAALGGAYIASGVASGRTTPARQL
jgi:SAM-dependent methyltransferase